ncbi:carcinine transporter-like [Copidosoma floridanum]|uniref:carcinine transporter-like n=1 Tax=Copidosoma floridanum TaxID=29053 RepID=UPI0006C99610|nr:carcinine transporter-like [Copidosoma floridanum]
MQEDLENATIDGAGVGEATKEAKDQHQEEEEEEEEQPVQREEEDSEMRKSKEHGPNERTALRPRMKLASFDDALPYVGDFGRYQLYLLIALLPYSVAYASLYFSQFFLTLVPREHWCKVDELLNVLTPEQRIAAAIPKSTNYPYYQTCRRKDLNYREIVGGGVPGPTSRIWTTNQTLGCDSWEYNLTQIPYASIGAELDWVCERTYLISTAQAIFYCGSITGGFLFSWIADHRGRVPALVLCAGCGLVASIATATTSAFWSFALCRFFTGLAFDNVINIPLIIVVEYMAVRRRSLVVNIAFGVYFAIGSTLLPWLAYYIANWRLFCFISALPLATCFITPWILPESARWYVSNRMSDKVIEKLKRIASVNKAKPDPNFYSVLYRNLNSSDNKTESATLIDLFKTPRLARKTIILTAFWALVVTAFDGHVYSLKLLDSSVFVSFSLACATELPAGLLLALIIDRWGRRFCGFITMSSTALFSFAEILLDSSEAKLAMSISSRFALNMAANVGLQYAAELLPTPVRAQGVGMIHIVGILAHSIAPYIVDTLAILRRIVT